jgi:hypothetical protein
MSLVRTGKHTLSSALGWYPIRKKALTTKHFAAATTIVMCVMDEWRLEKIGLGVQFEFALNEITIGESGPCARGSLGADN